jgi:3-hydroxyacyl-CoA dehydrogenase
MAAEKPAASLDSRRSAAVLGAGLMGRQIALAHLQRGADVTLFDVSPAALTSARGWIEDHPPRDSRRGVVMTAGSVADLAGCTLLVEAVMEDLTTKQRLLAAAEAALPESALFLTNTSSLPVSGLAEALRRPGRFCGMHFCHPLAARRLVEIVPGAETTSETLSDALAYARFLGRVPLVVRDGPGFLLNRLLMPYLGAALELLEEGAGVEAIEAGAREIGMPVCPLSFLDEIGIETAVRVSGTFYRAFPGRLRPSGLLIALYKSGACGVGSGAGFFLYRQGRPTGVLNPLVGQWIDSHRDRFSPAEVASRLLEALRREAALALDEGITARADDIQLALRHGVGFRGSFQPL